MGATTKSGRTRNRRAIPISNPPDGYPQLATFYNGEKTGATTYTLFAASAAFDGWPYDGFTGSGLISVFNGTALALEPVTVTWVSEDQAFLFTNPLNWDAGVNYFVPGWLENLRGFNGEWFAPFIITIPP